MQVFRWKVRIQLDENEYSFKDSSCRTLKVSLFDSSTVRSVEVKISQFGNFALALSPGGRLLYNGRYGCVSRTFKSLPFAFQNFNLAKFWTLSNKWQIIFKNIYPKRQKMNF